MFYRDGINEQHSRQCNIHLKLYQSILSLVPNFKKTIKEFGDNFGSIMDLISLVRQVSGAIFLLRAMIDREGILKYAAARHIQVEGRYTGIFYISSICHSRATNLKG